MSITYKTNTLNLLRYTGFGPSLNLVSGGDLANETLVNFTRSTIKKYFDSDGLMKEAAINTLPPSYDPATGERLGWLIEESRTNEALHARDLTQTEWVKTNGTALQDEVGLDGNTNSASSFEATSANATVLQSLTDGTSQERTYSVYIKRLVGSGTIEITIDGGTTWTDITSSIDSSDYSRVDVTKTDTNPEIGIRVVTSGDKIAVDVNQIEDASFPTSPIITGGSAVTRSTDVADITDLSWFNQDEGTFYVDINLSKEDRGEIFYVSDGTTTSRLVLGVSSGGDWFSGLRKNGTDIYGSFFSEPVSGYIGNNKAAVAYGENYFRLYINGSKIYEDNTGSVSNLGFTRLDIGNNTVDTPFNDQIKSLVFYQKALSESRLQAITS